MSDAVAFLRVDKHESLLPIDTKIFWWVRKIFWCIPEVPKRASLQCFYNIPSKVRDEVDFFDVDKHQSFLTVDLNTLSIKAFYSVTGIIMKTCRTWWWEWSSILKVLTITSLRCLYNISKKKLRMEFSIFDLNYRFLMKVAKHVQSTQKGSLLNFSNILRKSIATAFVLYCDAKHSDTLLGSSHVCCYLFLGGCGQKWAWSFRSWNSEICCISREWIDKMNWFFCMLIQI